VSQFYRLMAVVLISGTIAGFFLFGIQHLAVVPLIERAERFEAGDHDSEGWERVAFTAITTILSGIGLAAILFGSLAVSGRYPDTRQGALWGAAAFVCFNLAPALGLPPQPPGVALADLQYRQLWWAGTVVATAMGLWLIASPGHGWLRRIAGAIFIAIPHMIGAPAGTGQSVVPLELIHRFAITSLATSALFWPLLGAIGGRVNTVHAAQD
jgi:cobalt transporter subunit CbtA